MVSACRLPLAALGRLAHLAAFGAPTRLIAINAGALVAAGMRTAFG
jgi:hypothetical protein